MRCGRRLRAPLVLVSSMIALCLLSIPSLNARPLTWARAADATTLDPHSVNDGIAITFNQQIYEPLVQRNFQGKLIAVLAESWTLTTDPTVWEFRLRRGVRFHDGTPLTVDDVVFSLARARQPASQFRPLLSSIAKVSKVDATTLHIKTRGPTPLLPGRLTHVLIMSKAWAKRHNASRVATLPEQEKSYAYAHANGTGPFVLASREPGVRTVLDRNDQYWGLEQSPIPISQLIYRPIANPEARVKALVDGEVDFVQDVPIDALQNLQAKAGIDVVVGPENKSIFLGLNVGPGELESSDIKRRNPLADLRVRQAINIAIDRRAIQREVTLGNSIPTGSIVPPGVNGYNRALDKIPAHDVARAKALMADAGLGNGFSIRLDCPNNLYVRDEATCGAIAAQLGKIGIKVRLGVREGKVHMALVRSQPPGTDFYLLGLSVPTFDSESILRSLFHTRNDEGGHLNATRFGDREIDRLTDSLAKQTDFIARNETITRLWQTLTPKLIYVPLHIQTVAYAMKSDVSVSVDIENLPQLKTATVRQTQ